jgi:anthranilate synthase component II
MIIVIDNYDSFTYNLVHMLGRHTAEVEVYRNDAVSVDQVREMRPTGILISPGPGRPADAGITEAIIGKLGPEIPILGVCLGHQAIGEVYGGNVTYAPTLMHGKTSEVFHTDRGVFAGARQGFTATRYHSLVVDRETLPEELEVTAETPDGVIMGLQHRDLPVCGIQFHPESVLTAEGPRLIANWLRLIGIPLAPPTATSQD